MRIRHSIKYIVFPVFLITQLCCQNEHVNSVLKPTVITGKIVDYNRYSRTKTIKLSSLDHNFDIEESVARISEDGLFRIEFLIESSKQYYLKPFANTYIYANPGDSINIIIDPNKPSLTRFSGDSKQENENLNLFYSGGYFSPYNVTMDELENMRPEEFKDLMDSVKFANLDRLNRFGEQVDLSEDLYASLQALVYNDSYSGLFEYGLSRCSALNQPKDIELKLQDDYLYYKDLMDSMNRNGNKLGHHTSINNVLDLYLHYLLRYHLQLGTFRSDDHPIAERLLFEITESLLEPSVMSHMI